jgi:hypothetical protein
MSSQKSTQSGAGTRGHRETSFIEPSGGLLTEQLIYKLRDESCSEVAVKPQTFEHPGESTPASQTDLESRIGEIWEDLVERWDEVTRGYELYAMDVSDARTKWILPLFEALGFEPEYQQANLQADEIEANLSHLGWPPRESVAAGEDVPDSEPPILHSIQPDEDHRLDNGSHTSAEGRKQSPHDELQRYLNANQDVQWSIVTDGLKLRLLRDYYHTYARGYIEFDLENIFTERNYDDFRALYRLCHASRFVKPENVDNGHNESELPVEQFYQVAISTGVKVGKDLQENVVKALETLGNGLLNNEIQTILEENKQDATEQYYQDLLYVVYRILFLLFAEQRGMMSDRESVYTEEYSITKLRARAERRDRGDHNTDLWEGLKNTFRLVSEGNKSLGVPAYNGGLFDNDNLKFILNAECPNDNLLETIHYLTHIEQEGYRQRISYADLGVEEIGAVYESLLEFTPQIAETVLEIDDRKISSGDFYLDPRGMGRKETGSFYTDPALIQNLIRSSLQPITDRRLNQASDDVESQEEALLDITVCDPACGSGAFLIAANNYLAKRLAEIRSESSYPSEKTVRHAKRSVVQHCLYGVDKNPMAVELAKVSLWINSAVEDKPLSFLDHRIKEGNSLIGTTPELVSNGVPDGAFETSKGRDNHPGTEIRRLVRKENDNVQSDLTWYSGDQNKYVTLADRLEDIDEEEIRDIQQKERIYRELRDSESFQRERLAHDVWTAAFYWPLEKHRSKIEESEFDEEEFLEHHEDEFPTPKTIEKVRYELPDQPDLPINKLKGLQYLRKRAENIANKEAFFHWHLEFPKIFFQDSGFDCILGNPPWDKIEIEEREFFAVSAPEIASQDTQSKRRELISRLEETNPDLYEKYIQKVNLIERRTRFAKESGRFSLTGQGHLNTYALFAELALDSVNDTGRSGIIVPTGITTDYYTQDFFQKIIDDKNLVNLFDFENRKIFFPDVHSSFKFSLLTLTGDRAPIEEFEFGFYLTDIEQLHDEERRFSLSPKEIELLNPNTKNCPTFRTRKDANKTIKIYNNIGVLKNESIEENPWGISLKRMFNRSDDSDLFYTIDQLGDNKIDVKKVLYSADKHEYLPLYESKYIHQYDYRFSTYEDVEKERVTNDNPVTVNSSMKNNVKENIIPKFWVKKENYESKWTDDWHLVLRMVTNATNERTVIASIIPGYPTVNSLNHILGCSAKDSLLLLASLNSYVLDYAARQKLGGENLNQYIIKQLPIPSRSQFKNVHAGDNIAAEAIKDITIQLMYTGEELQKFATEAGYEREPYNFTAPNGEDRQRLRYRLEALMWKIYGLGEEDFEVVFDSFKQIKSRDIEEYGYYRTREEIKQEFLNL